MCIVTSRIRPGHYTVLLWHQNNVEEHITELEACIPAVHRKKHRSGEKGVTHCPKLIDSLTGPTKAPGSETVRSRCNKGRARSGRHDTRLRRKPWSQGFLWPQEALGPHYKRRQENQCPSMHQHRGISAPAHAPRICTPHRSLARIAVKPVGHMHHACASTAENSMSY